MKWTTVDALFLASIVNREWLPSDSASRLMSPLAETLYQFDGLNRGLPSIAEAEVAIHRLVQAGLVAVEDHEFHPTPDGLALAERAPPPGAAWVDPGYRYINYPAVMWIEEQLALYPLAAGRWLLDPSEFSEASREYNGWSRSEHKRK